MAGSIKFHLKKAAVAVAFVALSGTATAAADVWDGSLPVAGDPLTSQQYQDFTIYSLNYLSNLADLNPGLLPSPTYNVASGVGQLKEYVVIGTGNTGDSSSNLDTCGDTSTNKVPISGCDNSYQVASTPATYFNSMTETEPDVAVLGEPTRSTWTATADALREFLGDDSDMVFMFNLNEANKNSEDANTLAGQSLLVSMRVELTDENGDPLAYFYVGANNAIGLPLTAAEAWELYDAPIADPEDLLYNPMIENAGDNGYYSKDPRWAFVHGAISVDTDTGAFLAMGDCTFTGKTNCTTVNQNLGADQFSFSAFSQALSDMIYNDPDVFYMNIDVLTSGQSNGFEQLVIMAANIPTQVPEPGSLALAGLGLLGLGLIRRRRQSSTQA